MLCTSAVHGTDCSTERGAEYTAGLSMVLKLVLSLVLNKEYPWNNTLTLSVGLNVFY